MARARAFRRAIPTPVEARVVASRELLERPESAVYATSARSRAEVENFRVAWDVVHARPPHTAAFYPRDQSSCWTLMPLTGTRKCPPTCGPSREAA
jgi:hypothetical protein